MFWEHREGGAEGSWAVAQQEVEPDKNILHNGHIQAWLTVWTEAHCPSGSLPYTQHGQPREHSIGWVFRLSKHYRFNILFHNKHCGTIYNVEE